MFRGAGSAGLRVAGWTARDMERLGEIVFIFSGAEKNYEKGIFRMLLKTELIK